MNALGANVACDMIAEPAVGVWKDTDVDDVVDFFGMKLRGPRWNFLAHHFCSTGRDSVGSSGLLEAAARIIDFVVDAWSVFKDADVLNSVIIVVGLLFPCTEPDQVESYKGLGRMLNDGLLSTLYF